MLREQLAMQDETRIHGKFATGAKYSLQEQVYICDWGDLYVGDIIQHREKVYVEVCPDIYEVARHEFGWDKTKIVDLLRPHLEQLGIKTAGLAWAGGIHGRCQSGGQFILLT